MQRTPLLSTLALTVLGALALFGCRSSSPTVAPSDPSAQGIVVTGQGEAKGAPDMATIQMGVQARAQTAEAATDEVAAKIQDVIAALKAAGIDAKDIQTQNLSIHEERDWEPPPPRPLPEGGEGMTEPVEGPRAGKERRRFVAQNMVSVTARDLDRLPEVLGAATRAGVNQMYGIHLELDDPTALEAEARQKAFAEARAKAEHLAQLGGVELGRLVSVQLTSGGGGPYPMAMAEARDAATSMPVERGEITVQQHVQLRYELK